MVTGIKWKKNDPNDQVEVAYFYRMLHLSRTLAQSLARILDKAIFMDVEF